VNDVERGYLCPVCGHKFDAFTMVGDNEWHPPGVGDLGLCIECGDLHTFTIVGPRSLTSKEYKEVVSTNPTIRKVLSAWSTVRWEK
jgi:hypothetical protein